MALEQKDRVSDTSTTTGTGALTLASSAPPGFRSFASAHLDGESVRYAISSVALTDWEVGEGVYSAGTLTRATVFASSNSGGLVDFAAGTKTVAEVMTAASTRLDLGHPSAAREWFGASGVTLASTPSQISGDPFVVWDGTQFVMYYFATTSGSPYVSVWYRTAPTLEGAWSAAANLTAFDNYHKLVLLVDEKGAPVNVAGNYHAYAVKFLGSIADKEIYHFTCSTLTGAWALGSKVIAKGSSGSKDEYNADTPYALYKDGVIRLWYMGAPAGALATYGLAVRMLVATAASPDGPFTKNSTDVMLPSTIAAWDYGWLGGVQVRVMPDGTYMMVYNAGDTRPAVAGTEPNTSRIGYAYARSLDGPWEKDRANPYFTPTGVPSDSGQTIESTNIWRGHLAFDQSINRWYMFYNTGTGTEKVTYARQGVYDYFDAHAGVPYNIQTITTSAVVVANTRVNVTPGLYRVHYQFNIGDLGVTKPALDIDTVLRLNGTAVSTARDFIGSYNYENRDIVLRKDIAVAATGYFDVTVQCTGGTPTANSLIRRLRVTVERI